MKFGASSRRQQMPDKLYYAKGMEVWKSPIRTKIEGGESVTLGFHACTASEAVGEEGATAIAALLCLGEEAQAAPKNSETGWQPISTAPHSKQVLVFVPRADHPENPPVGSWQIAYQTEPAPPLQQTWRYSNGQFRGQQIGWPTHWMPLPDAPAPKDRAVVS
ncbi:MAG: hypothetical protein BGN83_14700 [Rhizobium sp. 63-7]|nr:MAG: hypothetical protein BGN83_14700 [Rhizobium sp. 63-7]